MGYLVIADTAMVLHFAYLGFLIVGGFLAWRWPKVFWAHLLCGAWAFGTILIGFPCPLTDLEDWARVRGGREPLVATGFIDHYIVDVLFPAEQKDLVEILVLILIAISWIVLAALWIRRRRRARDPSA